MSDGGPVCSCGSYTKKFKRDDRYQRFDGKWEPVRIYECIAPPPPVTVIMNSDSQASAKPSVAQTPSPPPEEPITSPNTSRRTDEGGREVASWGRWSPRQVAGVAAIGIGAAAILAGVPLFCAGSVAAAAGVALAFVGVGAVFTGYALVADDILAPLKPLQFIKRFIVD
jgi:hypothetical protein